MGPQVGRVIQHRFELRALLARSGPLYVLRAWDRLQGVEVVVKLIPPQRLAEERGRALMTAYVSQPHWQVAGVAPLVEVLRDDPGPGWVRAHAHGRSFGDLLEQAGRLHWSEALTLLRPTVEQLARLHRKGLAHGHLVPGNVFPRGEDSIWLTDAGWLATLREAAPDWLARSIDPRFCSPEILRGQVPGLASDVYGFGLLVYSALTGSPPFAVGSLASIAAQHTTTAPPSLASRDVDAPGALEAALGRWLTKAPAERTPDAIALLQQLDELIAELEEEPTRALPPVEAAMPSPTAAQPADPVTETAGTAADPSWDTQPPAELVPAHRHGFGRLLGQVGAFIILTILLTSAILAGVGLAAWSIMLKTMPAEVEVPDVRGMSLVQAQTVLGEQELTLMVSREQPNAQVPNGHLLASDPPAGRRVRQHRQIKVVVSTGRELVTVPSVLEFTVETARERLERAGLHVGLEQQVWDDLVPEGRVVSQSPAAGVKVEKGVEVVLVISQGRQPEEEEDEEEPAEDALPTTALVRVVIPPSPPTQHLRVLVRDMMGAHAAVDRYCLAGEEVTAEIRGVGDTVVEVYLNQRLVTRRSL